MWTKWVTIHQSFGVPRAAQDCRTYLEQHGIYARIQMNRRKQMISTYWIQVPRDQEKQARELLTHFRKNL
ncbi:MAG: hypothetical protein ACM32O_15745 [Clostridia bacterium]